MTEFINSGKNSPCPLCDRTHDRDCSWTQDLNLILCHGLVEECPQEIRGYRFVKIAKGGYHGESAEYLRIKEAAPTWQKPPRPNGQKIYHYPTLTGEKLVRVTRKDQNGKKSFPQQHWNDEEWVTGLTEEVKQQVRLYRITELLNQQALKQGRALVVVEGEGKVDQLLAMGIAATCCLGGAGKWGAYGGAHGNYLADLQDVCQNRLILCPDRDQPGVKHCEDIQKDFPDAVWFYVGDPSEWENLPKTGGYDIGDWLADQQKAGRSESEIINQIIEEAGPKKEFSRSEAIKASIETALKDSLKKIEPPEDLDPANEVIDCSIENHIYRRLFKSGSGEYCVIDDNFCKYTGRGYWQVLEERKVKQAIARLANKAYKLRYTKDSAYPVFCYGKDGNVVSTYRFCRDLLSIEPTENRHLRCFTNCTVDLRTGAELEHCREHYLTTSIDADYQAGAECPEEFRRFIASAYGEDLLPVVRACTSMLLDSTAPYGHIIHLVGPSGSGKGTLLRFWGSMFGLNQTRSGSGLSELIKAEGRHQNLSGVAVFFCPDIGGHQQELRAAYELADNGPMTGRALYTSSTYQKQFNVRLVVASVDYLSIENSGDGWNRRVIPLPSKPRYGLADQQLEAKLQAIKAQAISWCLGMSHADRNYVLNHLEEFSAIAQSKRDGAIASDPVRLFVDMCLTPGDEDRPEECLDSKKLHSYYTAFCQAFGYYPVHLQRFVGHLKGVLPEYFVPRQRSKTDWSIRILSHWRNVEVITSAFEDSTEGLQPKCVKRFCKEGQLDAFTVFSATHFANHRETSSDSQSTINVPHVPQRPSGFEGVSGRSQSLTEQGLQESRPSRPSGFAHAHGNLSDLVSDSDRRGEEKNIESKNPRDVRDVRDVINESADIKGFENVPQLSHNWHIPEGREGRDLEIDPDVGLDLDEWEDL